LQLALRLDLAISPGEPPGPHTERAECDGAAPAIKRSFRRDNLKRWCGVRYIQAMPASSAKFSEIANADAGGAGRRISSLMQELGGRDPYTMWHSLRVRSYALRLADAVELEARLRRPLGLGARLHDIGKLALPEALLKKSADLTFEEEASVREHPVVGERMLAPMLRNRHVLAIVRGHHERYDGRGYPDGLQGEGIPLLARLVAIADCFDALTSSRAYREAISRARALEIISAGAATQFDPELVRHFIAMMGQR
jgi:HD-GYP domain-containing protein (c-di-GMP phosphodiesterase class II)